MYLLLFFYNFLNFSMFRDVPGCSGMFRHVPECSMFRVLSTPVKSGTIEPDNLLIFAAQNWRSVSVPPIQMASCYTPPKNHRSLTS